MYYDYTRILSYNAFLNFIIGERGVGKTFGVTNLCIKDFLKKSNEFAYIRRYKSDLKKSVPTFFDVIKQKNLYPNTELKVKNNDFFINGFHARKRFSSISCTRF